MTPEEWDLRWYSIRNDYIADGVPVEVANQRADRDAIEQFEPRPQETP